MNSLKQCLSLLLLTALAAASFAVELKGDGFRALFSGDGVDLVADGSGRKLYGFSGLDLAAGPCVPSANADGSVDLRCPLKGGDGDYALFRFTLRGARLDAAVTVKTTAKLATRQIRRRSFGSDRVGKLIHSGIWFRPENGGLPYEKRGVAFRVFPAGELAVYEKISGNPAWADASRQHIALARDPKTGLATGSFSCLVLPAARETLAAAMLNRESLRLELPARRPFQLWQTGSGKPAVTVLFANPGDTARQVRYRAIVRDYDGTAIYDRSGDTTVAPRGQTELPIEPALAGERGIWFVEVAADTGEFARTMIGLLPEHRFAARKEGIFGIAAAFEIPSRGDVAALLRRMGVGWVREMGKTSLAREIDAHSLYHSNRPANAMPGEANRARRDAYIADQLQRARQLDAVGWEFPNEWNMKSLNKGTGADVLARDYYQAIRQKNAGLKLYGPALAGGDLAFLRKLAASGDYQQLDALTFHPGRGNMTADYAGREYWCYLGALRRVREFMAHYPDKPLFLTEIYACTKPNSWWHDSYRHAADNIVLMYALALKERVAAAFFYQLHDGVWFNPGGVKPEDPEYYYGLLHRDGTVKPSLLAYCHIAETLENARYVRDLTFPQKSVKGLLFERAGVPVALLWNREEGYFQSRKSADFKHGEPWQPVWRKKSAVTLPAQTGTLEIRDAIGRPRQLPAPGGKAEISVTGSPVTIIGLHSDLLK